MNFVFKYGFHFICWKKKSISRRVIICCEISFLRCVMGFHEDLLLPEELVQNTTLEKHPEGILTKWSKRDGNVFLWWSFDGLATCSKCSLPPVPWLLEIGTNSPEPWTALNRNRYIDGLLRLFNLNLFQEKHVSKKKKNIPSIVFNVYNECYQSFSASLQPVWQPCCDCLHLFLVILSCM